MEHLDAKAEVEPANSVECQKTRAAPARAARIRSMEGGGVLPPDRWFLRELRRYGSFASGTASSASVGMTSVILRSL